MKLQTYIYLLILLFVSCSYIVEINNSWQSEFHNVYIEFKDPMQLLSNKIDEKDKLLVLCFDSSKGQGFVIKIDKDLPLEQLTDSMYYVGLKQTMLTPSPENKLLSESDTLFHGDNYHSMVFYMSTPKGNKKIHCNILRKNGFMFSVQIFYPCEKEKIMENLMPIELIKQDKLIKINEK